MATSSIFGPGIASNTFTPVRRRESTINNNRFQKYHEQEWTAARCHRLLRALTSRVAILNKEISRYTSVKQAVGSQANYEALSSWNPSTLNKSTNNDTEWTRENKKVKQTYSSRRGRGGRHIGDPGISRILATAKGRTSLAPGEVLVPTPVLARARGEDPFPLPVPMSELQEIHAYGMKSHKRTKPNDADTGFKLSETLRDIRKNTTASRFTVYEGIYNGLETLLRSTAKVESKNQNKGARPLFSMTLRAVPKYITEQESLLAEHMKETGSKSALNTRDISTEIYDELEEFGSSSQSWKHLRTIVRSHGVQVVGDAIQAGLLDVEFCGTLITLCIQTSAIEEAEILLSTLLSSTRFPQPKTVHDSSRKLSMLWKFTEHTGRLSFLYQQLTQLLSIGVLPVSWLATKQFGSVWAGLMHSLSPEPVRLELQLFLEASLNLLAIAARPENDGNKKSIIACSGLVEAVKKTFSSLLTTLSSIVILSRERTTQSYTEYGRSGYGQIIRVLQSCCVQYKLSRASNNSQGALLLMANLIVGHKSDATLEVSCPSVDLLLEELRQRGDNFNEASTTYNDLVMFICKVAHCCGRGASTDGFECLEEIHILLETLVCDRGGSDSLKGIIVDSGHIFAQKVPERRHLDYASSMDLKFSARVVESSICSVSQDADETKSGFRWEEGIGEWVTATPVIKTAKRKSISAEGESDCDTPFRPPPNLRQKIGHEKTPISIKVRTLQTPIEFGISEVESSEDDLMASFNEDGLIDSSSPSIRDNSPVSVSSYRSELSGDPEDSEAPESETEGSTRDSFISSRSSPYPARYSMSKPRPPPINRAPRLNRNLLQESQHWQLFDESSASKNSSSSFSSPRNGSQETRQYIDCVPRLGRRALRGSQAWQIFDESDDELSFVSVSSQSSQVMQDITTTSISNIRQLRATKSSVKPRKFVASPILSDSEDELCI